jgi:SAM-dependent methyltransferase
MDYREIHLAKGDKYDATLAAHPFDAYMGDVEAGYLREIVPALMHGRGRYLDFACGTGRITSIVSPLVGESVAVDISESMLAVARTKCPSTRFVCADLTRESPDLRSFDLVTSFRFFGNAQHDLRSAALGAIAPLVRPGGHLIVNSHRNPHAIGALLQSWRGRDHGMDLTFGKMKRLLRDHGFDVVAVRSIASWVIRARMRTADVLQGRLAPLAERAFGHRVWAPLAPDCIIVARKRER